MKKLLLILLALAVIVGGGLFYLHTHPAATLSLARAFERGQAGLEQKEIVVDGEPWPYLEGGKGETIVMLHGFGADKDNWTRFSQYFTDKYHVVAPDLPGFGEAPRHWDWDYTIPAQSQRLHAFVDALGLERFHIVGNSMGGNLAGYYTAEHPQRVITLGLFNNSGVTSPEPSEMTLALERGENPLLVDSPEDFDKLLDFVFVEKPPIPDSVKRYLGQQAIENREFNAYVFEQYSEQRPGALEPKLREVEQPTLILWGDTDRLLHVSSIETMRPLLENETVVVMEDMGHSPMIERPEDTAKHYLKFLKEAD